MTKWIVYGVAVTCTVLAMLVPWTSYGDTGFGLIRFPGWPIYLVGAVVLHACTWWRSTAGRVVAAAGGLTALITAIAVMRRYDDPSAVFDGPVILVVPVIGFGGFLAVAGALLGLGLVAYESRRAG